MVPNAFWDLGVLLFPVGMGGHAGSATEAVAVVIPTAPFDDPGVKCSGAEGVRGLRRPCRCGYPHTHPGTILKRCRA